MEQLAVLGIDEQDARRALRATGVAVSPTIGAVDPLAVGCFPGKMDPQIGRFSSPPNQSVLGEDMSKWKFHLFYISFLHQRFFKPCKWKFHIFLTCGPKIKAFIGRFP